MHRPALTLPVAGAALLAAFTMAPVVMVTTPATAATVVTDSGSHGDTATGSDGHDDEHSNDMEGMDHSTHGESPEAETTPKLAPKPVPEPAPAGGQPGTAGDDAHSGHGSGDTTPEGSGAETDRHGDSHDTDAPAGEPADEHGEGSHGDEGTEPVSRPRGLVLGSFGVFNGAVLLYAARLRRRTAGDHQRRRAARAAALSTTIPATATDKEDR